MLHRTLAEIGRTQALRNGFTHPGDWVREDLGSGDWLALEAIFSGSPPEYERMHLRELAPSEVRGLLHRAGPSRGADILPVTKFQRGKNTTVGIKLIPALEAAAAWSSSHGCPEARMLKAIAASAKTNQDCLTADASRD